MTRRASAGRGGGGMRVIAGAARGRRLQTPHDAGARPPLALARGALFNRLGEHIRGAAVLDLYAGSGSLGIEALSRGAAWAVFVEQEAACADAIRANLAHCRLDDRAEVRVEPAAAALGRMDGQFDLVFVDPPYAAARAWEASDEGGTVVRATARLLAPAGILVFRAEADADLPATWGGHPRQDTRTYGRSRFAFYEAAGAET